MKLNKIISFVLSFGIILSTFAGIMTVNADITDFTLTNVAVNGGFDEDLAGTWAISTSASGSLTIEDDTKDSSNKVLRYDGTGNTGSISYINYASATANHTYYMSLKVRVADADTTSGDMYLYANSLGGETKAYYSSTRPKITKDGWAVCSGIVTPTSTNIGFKVISDQTKSSSNIKNAIYEIDDVVLYDLTEEGFYKLTLPTDVSIVSGAFTSNSKMYAKSNNPVVLNYEGADKIVSAGTADVTKNGNTYTFAMPAADTNVTLVDPPLPAFTNLVENGDMQDQENNKWVPHDSSAVGSVVKIVEDSKDPSNKVLQFDGTNNTGSISYMSYPDLTLTKGSRYYYSYKIRLVKCEDTSITKFYAYNNNFTGTNNLHRPEITDSWITRSGIIENAGANKFNFKITNTYTSSSGTANVPKVIYEIDDVVIYDFNAITEIVLPKNTTLVEGGKRLDVTNSATDLRQVPHYYAKAGDEVKLEYTGKDELGFEGVDATLDGNIYTFTMPEINVGVSELKDIDFSMVEQIPNITVKSPQSFVIIAAKYSASKDLEVVYFADSETTVDSQTISLGDIAEFNEISDWTNMHIFVWNSLAEMRPLGDPYICAQ